MTQRADRIVLEYTPEDFYYLADAANMPSRGQCTVDPEKLSEYQRQLCLNEVYVNDVLEQQQVHSGMQQKLYDYQSKYYNEVMKSFNLGIGILAIISFLYYNQGTAAAA